MKNFCRIVCLWIRLYHSVLRSRSFSLVQLFFSSPRRSFWVNHEKRLVRELGAPPKMDKLFNTGATVKCTVQCTLVLQVFLFYRKETDGVLGDPKPDRPGEEGAFHPRLGISRHCSRYRLALSYVVQTEFFQFLLYSVDFSDFLCKNLNLIS